jgi:ABC-2 type transport system ATP-binding protein
VRELILNLARHHTILLSTHILPEVEMTCSRVLIINKGRVAAADSPQNLRHRLHQSGAIVLEVRPNSAREAEKQLGRLPGFAAVRGEEAGQGWMRFELDLEEGVTDDPRVGLAEFCRAQEWPLRELSRRAISLEDVFTRITKTEEL